MTNRSIQREIADAARRNSINTKTEEEIKELHKYASQHNPGTGFQQDSALALACGLELKIRAASLTTKQVAKMGNAMQLLKTAFGTQCLAAGFDREAHLTEVGSGDTRVWNYWEWLVRRIESEGINIEEFVASAQAGRYVCSTSWDHVFSDNHSMTARWIYDRQEERIVSAQFLGVSDWISLQKESVADLLESIQQNEAIDKPESFGLLQFKFLPTWMDIERIQVENGGNLPQERSRE